MSDLRQIMLEAYQPAPQVDDFSQYRQPFNEVHDIAASRAQKAEPDEPQALTEAQLHDDPTFQSAARYLYDHFDGVGNLKDGDIRGKTDWLVLQMQAFNLSLPKMLWDMSRLKDAPYEAVKHFYDAISLYDATPTTAKLFARGLPMILPEIAIGLGFSMLAKFASRGLTAHVVKGRLRDIIMRSQQAMRDKTNRTIGAIEGGAYEGGLSAGRERVDAEAEDRQMDAVTIGADTATGMVAGFGLGWGIDKLGADYSDVKRMLPLEPIK